MGIVSGIGELINVLCSIAVIPLTIMLSIIYILRKVGKNRDKNCWVNRKNRSLRKKHIPIGIATMITGLFHAIWASNKHGWYLSWGKVAGVLLILLCLSYIFRKKLKSSWIIWHRILTVAFVISIILHIALIPEQQMDQKFPATATTEHSGS